MVVLDAKGISKSFPGVKALNNVGLTLNSGEIHCIVGENGAGKSTLVKILTGILTAEQGNLFIDGKLIDKSNKELYSKVAYVPQELNLFKYMTVAENIFLPFDKTSFSSFIVDTKKIEAATKPYLEKLNMTVDPSNRVINIPVSEQQLLQVARAITRQNFSVLILDEPTTSLTRQETERFFAILRSLRDEGKSIVFISHKLDEVFSLGDRISVLRNGELVGVSDIKKVDSAWAIEKMTGEEIDVRRNYRPKTAAGELLLEVDKLSGIGFEDISFNVHKGEIVGFAGLVGAGRTEIMQTIFGYLPEKSGEVLFKGKKAKFRNTAASIKNGIIYLTEERKTHGILPYLSVRENIGVILENQISTLGVVNSKSDNSISDKVLRNYNVKATSREMKIINLSGGNQQKVLIGRTMESSPEIIIFDEPTKGIDVKTKEEIYLMMQKLAEENQIGIILISSEIEELLKCSSRIITVYNGKKLGEFAGNQLNTGSILSSIIGITETNQTERTKP
ncbi:MAG: sugar ABC transporter ATP-binding protein [Treponema sp.]|jgi:ribose transport system ATP-binding protein|nr:sugar ABC transporter ATP-binding protein [Treponema sp.]